MAHATQFQNQKSPFSSFIPVCSRPKVLPLRHKRSTLPVSHAIFSLQPFQPTYCLKNFPLPSRQPLTYIHYFFNFSRHYTKRPPTSLYAYTRSSFEILSYWLVLRYSSHSLRLLVFIFDWRWELLSWQPREKERRVRARRRRRRAPSAVTKIRKGKCLRTIPRGFLRPLNSPSSRRCEI